MISETELAGAVAARICHDVIGPLGAIGNGLELMAMAPEGTPLRADSAEMGLISESAGVAMARLQVLRLAFGPAQPGANLGAEALERALGGLALGPRVALSAEIVPPALPRQAARAALLGLMCLARGLGAEGRLALGCTGAGAWQIVAEGALALAPWQRAALGGAAPEALPPPSDVEFALFAPALAEAGLRASAQIGEGRAQLSF